MAMARMMVQRQSSSLHHPPGVKGKNRASLFSRNSKSDGKAEGATSGTGIISSLRARVGSTSRIHPGAEPNAVMNMDGSPVDGSPEGSSSSRPKSMVAKMLSKIEEVIWDEVSEEKLSEPPTSWHHGARLSCLARKSSMCTRLSWYCSSIMLVIVQMLVMLSFLSALYATRCMSKGDCATASYCANLRVSPPPRDPLDPAKQIQRGVCLGCGARLSPEEHIDGLLEVLCPGGPSSNSSVGVPCLQSCMNSCTASSPFVFTVKHVDDYSATEKTCATSCTLSSCSATLSGEVGHMFDRAVGYSDWRARGANSDGVPFAYVVWLSIIDQCSTCEESVRQGIRFATPPEVENLRILKMSFIDFVSLGLASLIVALTMMREVRDMNIGQMMTLQALQRDYISEEENPDQERELTDDHERWRMLLGIQAFMRRYLILPDVAMVTVLMIARFGGDTVSIMLNTLAALFMLELDNLAFDFGLTAQTKSKIEEDFKVELGHSQRMLLQWSRRWHVLSLTTFLVVMTTTLPFLSSIQMRFNVMSGILVGIVGMGEIIEITLRWTKRTARSNLQRTVMLVAKMVAAILYKQVVARNLSWFAGGTAALDLM